MSLDIYLHADKPFKKKVGTGIFVRENGKTFELTEKEAEARYADHLISIPQEGEVETDVVYHDNITHNLNKMADAAGIYTALWRPEELAYTKAHELIDPLREGLHKLKTDPDKFKALNPKNGWGTYDNLVEFVTNYLDACYKYPDAKIEASR